MSGERWTSESADAITRACLSVVLVGLIGVALVALFQHEIPLSNHDVVILIIGGLLAKLTDVFAYSFNSSASSARKDKTLATAVAQANTPPASADSIALAPGQTATTSSTPTGTIIDKEPAP